MALELYRRKQQETQESKDTVQDSNTETEFAIFGGGTSTHGVTLDSINNLEVGVTYELTVDCEVRFTSNSQANDAYCALTPTSGLVAPELTRLWVGFSGAASGNFGAAAGGTPLTNTSKTWIFTPTSSGGIDLVSRFIVAGNMTVTAKIKEKKVDKLTTKWN